MSLTDMSRVYMRPLDSQLHHAWIEGSAMHPHGKHATNYDHVGGEVEVRTERK